MVISPVVWESAVVQYVSGFPSFTFDPLYAFPLLSDTETFFPFARSVSNSFFRSSLNARSDFTSFS